MKSMLSRSISNDKIDSKKVSTKVDRRNKPFMSNINQLILKLNKKFSELIKIL